MTMPGERRNLNFVARKRRAEFERSLQTLRGLGFPAWALECYRRVARVSGQLPHEVVTRVAVLAAGHILQNPAEAVSPTIHDEDFAELETTPALRAALRRGHGVS